MTTTRGLVDPSLHVRPFASSTVTAAPSTGPAASEAETDRPDTSEHRSTELPFDMTINVFTGAVDADAKGADTATATTGTLHAPA